MLSTKHPYVFTQFMKGKFVAQKTNNRFSCIALDQIHEHENVSVKGVAGCLHIFGNDSALEKWMICGPIVGSLL